ncbi:MAG: beta-N-acetylhexosaminidase [Clostridia bacterium]|nr:beta-N-acetylhexosaminidase [Clostridia bacterium]
MKNFKTFGVMLDMSRNAVMTVDALKKYMQMIRKMGYNALLLYCEDTYEVEGEPYFGYMRGKYSVAEMKEIDTFAQSLKMEVIPCIQTLSHLETTIRWNQFPTDNPRTLLVGEERCYQLIDNMFATLSKCFTSKRIHIGMDEAWGLGKGKYHDKNGCESVNSIMKKHLDRVTKLAEKYGYELLMWSDMFFAEIEGGGYFHGKVEMPNSAVEALPESVAPVYWDYYHTKEEDYDNMIYNHKQLTKNLWFAGSAYTSRGFLPNNRYSLKSMLPAMAACKKNKVKNFIVTMWGDNGAECSRYSTLPTLFYIAEYAKENTDDEAIKAKFEKKFGLSFDDFLLIDMANFVADKQVKQSFIPVNPSKYLFYADLFNGFTDCLVSEGANERYASLAEQLHIVAKKSRKYGYIFDNAATLCDVLALKSEMGVLLRAAYKEGRKWDLELYAKRDIPEIIRGVKVFAKAFEKQWMTENKPQGFDCHDIRFGGMLRRLEYCQKTLNAYLDGKRDCIPELEEEILPFLGKGTSTSYNDALRNMSPSALYVPGIY